MESGATADVAARLRQVIEDRWGGVGRRMAIDMGVQQQTLNLFISWTDYVGNRHTAARVADGDSVTSLLTYSAKESGSWGTEPMAKNERRDAAAFIQRAEDVEVYKANHQK